MSKRSVLFLTLALLGPGASAALAHGEAQRAYGEPGNPAKPARVIAITMKETGGKMLFQPATINVKRGEQIRFRITNAGEAPHEFMLATLADNLAHMKEMIKNPDMEHDDPNGITLKPKQTGEVLWLFNKAGTFDFSCLIPGHRDAGMFGKVVVK